MSHFARRLAGPSYPAFLKIKNETTISLYEQCALSSNGDILLMMQCISEKVDTNHETEGNNLQHWLLIVTGSLIFFMQAGFAMLCAGCVRKKNLQNTMLKNLLDACAAAVAFYVCGFAFAFSVPRDGLDKSFIGTTNFFLMGDVDLAFWFFEYTFSANSVTIVAGTLAERCQMGAYLWYSFFLTGFVYPIAARAMWSDYGFLSPNAKDPFGGIGAIDLSGSGVVHVTGGMTALIAAYLLGARKGRFTDSRGRPLKKPREFYGHSFSLQIMGTLILWFGWYGFNCGSTLLLKVKDSASIAALCAMNTALSSSCGAMSALFTDLFLEERKSGDFSYKISMAVNGLLAGLVAITAGCSSVEPWAACLIGLIAGWIYLAGSSLLLKWKIDDAVDAIPVHLFNGAWGLIAIGLFASPGRLLDQFGTEEHVGLFYGMGRNNVDFQLLINQVLALLFIASWATINMIPFFTFLNYMGWFRSDGLEELVGLDMHYHGGGKDLDVAELDEEDRKEYDRRMGKEDKVEDEEIEKVESKADEIVENKMDEIVENKMDEKVEKKVDQQVEKKVDENTEEDD